MSSAAAAADARMSSACRNHSRSSAVSLTLTGLSISDLTLATNNVYVRPARLCVGVSLPHRTIRSVNEMFAAHAELRYFHSTVWTMSERHRVSSDS